MALTLVLAPTGLAADAPEPVSQTQKRMQRLFPKAYAQATSEFGWHQFAEGTWHPLQAQLPRRGVVLVHGLDEPGKLWINVAPALSQAGLSAYEFRYPNDQPIQNSAAWLKTSLGELRQRGVEEIVLVAHSMGGLVCREMLTNPDLAQKSPIPSTKRLIMLCTPNHGSPLAHGRFAAELRDQAAHLIKGQGHLLSGFADGTGEAGADLVPGSPFLKALNARPHPQGIPFTIIAGVASPISQSQLAQMARLTASEPDTAKRRTRERLRSALASLAEGVGDGCVSLQSARLEGIEDVVVVPGNHLSTVRNVRRSSRRIPPAIPLVLQRITQVWSQPPMRNISSLGSPTVASPRNSE